MTPSPDAGPSERAAPGSGSCERRPAITAQTISCIRWNSISGSTAARGDRRTSARDAAQALAGAILAGGDRLHRGG
ncbi:hypothetical protein SUDANB70_00833 [Streptomyces sp. enrichment culture]